MNPLNLSDPTLRFISENADADVRHLALASHPADVDMQAALTQIAGHQAAVRKLPAWASVTEILYPPHLSMEQCTGQLLAEYKKTVVTGIFQGDSYRFTDLTGGFGVDCYYLSEGASSCCYNERDALLCSIAAHNFPLLGRPDTVISNLTAEEFLENAAPDSTDLIYMDPARRSQTGQKLVSIADCSPDASALQDKLLETAATVIIKLSPMLDIHRTLSELRHVSRVMVLSVAGECKELLVFMQRGFSGEPVIQAVNIDTDGKPGTVLQSTLPADAALPSKNADDSVLEKAGFLHEPYAAHMKSGLFRTISQQYGVWQLQQDSHLFLSEEPVTDFPGRSFRIRRIMDFDRRSASVFFKEIGSANIAVRNFPMGADELRKRFKVKDGGTAYVFATTSQSGRKLLIETEKA